MQIADWIWDAVFYHIFPLGCFGAPRRNPFSDPPANRIDQLRGWLDYLVELGINALLLGPVFESSTHGYDIADYFRVDRRLGDEARLAAIGEELHRRGIRLILDAVFHHTGRDFWAFRDVRQRGPASPYCNWYYLDFSQASPYGDPFTYQTWAGHYGLVKLNLANREVRDHLLRAVSWWIERFFIDGLRIDAADKIDLDFQKELAAHCRAQRNDFCLIGEVVHGDYRRWIDQGGLSATTNYEAYKGLWSSHKDRNYFEIAYALNRQFGTYGIYRGLPLYAFVDNHDVNRIATMLKDPAHLYPVYVILMTMPGVPSIYYGSEWGITGSKGARSDAPLRPALDPETMRKNAPYPELCEAIKRLICIRRRYDALHRGDYAQLHVSAEQLAFIRRHPSGSIVVTINAADRAVEVPLRGIPGRRLIDTLNSDELFDVIDGRCVVSVSPRWARIMLLQ